MGKSVDDCVKNSGMYAIFNPSGDYCPLEGMCKYQSEAHVAAKDQLFPVCRLRMRDDRRIYNQTDNS